MGQIMLIKNLKSQSTWRLFGLGLITYGIYWAHYIAKQTEVINRSLDDKLKISKYLVNTILAVSYFSLTMLIGTIAYEKVHLIEIASKVTDRIWITLILVWGFQARNRVNLQTGANPSSPNWFHGFWIFIFAALYFNYKINILNSETHKPEPAA
jgi:hypothetical protein